MSQFDRDCITYTQEGRILQLQYAVKAVESAQTIVGVKCKDGIVLGAEKLVFSKLLVEGTHRRIYNVEKTIGMALGGKIPDGRHIVNYARKEAHKFQGQFGITIDGRTLSDRLSLYLYAHTASSGVRPFGSAQIIASYTKQDGLGLYMLEPSGNYFGYSCCTAGRGRQSAKAQFQKTDYSKLTCEQSLFHIAKILAKTNEQSRDKKYEFEMSWIHEGNGFVHQMVPPQKVKEVQKNAYSAIQEQQMG